MRSPFLDQFLGLEEALEMAHLPGSHDDEDAGLAERPPEDALVRALGRLTEALLAVLEEENNGFMTYS